GTDEESGLDYWKVQNSWGPDWGEAGFFRILRGSNECGIEKDVVCGDPKITVPRNVEMAVTDEIVEIVNSLNTTWTASHNKYSHMSRSEFNGSRLTQNEKIRGILPVHEVYQRVSVPASFDSRDQWPGCIGAIRDQGGCGSCWAFSATEVFADRACIEGKTQTNIPMSPQYLIDCDNIDAGCGGGSEAVVWMFMKNKGVASEECLPYKEKADVRCPRTCVDGSPIEVMKAATDYQVKSNPASIQQEILANGPVQAGFTVYTDFNAYSTGVYQHVWGRQEGGHAIKIVGWGMEGSVPYWTVANSWGPDWGEDGFFRILRGSNECGIEADIYAGTVA
ncbi:peptidase C1A, partial [Kipferlia bialata]